MGKMTLIAIVVALSSTYAQADNNVISVSIGYFKYAQTGGKTYTTATGETGSMDWTNSYIQPSVSINYLRNIGGSIYIGGSVGNNEQIAATMGVGF